jgi:hypothetical protein
MRRSTAAIGSAVYFAVAAGTFAVLVPWLVTGWQFHRPWSYWVVARTAGVLLVGAGLVPAVSVFVQFARAPPGGPACIPGRRARAGPG